MYREQEYYNEYEEMNAVAAYCKNYSKINNISSFDMSNYRSCDNCKYFTPDKICKLNQSEDILFRMNME